jgi:hypothetical protein
VTAPINQATTHAALSMMVRLPDPDRTAVMGFPEAAIDADGQAVAWWVLPDPWLRKAADSAAGPVLASAMIPSHAGVPMAVAALRKLADLLELHGGTLLAEPVGAGGVFDCEGAPCREPDGLTWADFDERGRLP